MGRSKEIIALVYDFDGTLSPGNMQDFSFMKAIGAKSRDFWNETKELSEKNDASEILAYMYLMIKYAAAQEVSLKRESFKSFGKDVELFNGVTEWFDLINDYGKKKGVVIEHYINSSGLKEIIEGTPIAKKFKQIYACSFMYDIDGKAIWPSIAVDYTTKTQFLFKINKGIDEVRDNKKINEFVPENERRIPFRRIIYFGDGDTDIPSMRLVKQLGGYSIAVYKRNDKNRKRKAKELFDAKRVDFVCPADFAKDKDLYSTVINILDRICSESSFEKVKNRQAKKFL